MLDYLVRGPWRDPKGYNFPKTIAFTDWQLLPQFQLIPPSIGPIYVNLGAIFAVVAVIAGVSAVRDRLEKPGAAA